MCLAFFGTALCLIGVVLSKCDKTLSIIFFVLGMGLNGCCYSGFLSNYVDMAPDFAGILMGFCNSFGNTPGFIAPYVAAMFYSEGVIIINLVHFIEIVNIHVILFISKLYTIGEKSFTPVLQFMSSLKSFISYLRHQNYNLGV